jgi:hypothetical protein
MGHKNPRKKSPPFTTKTTVNANEANVMKRVYLNINRRFMVLSLTD